MKKIILTLLLLSNFLNAAYLYDKDSPLCIDDFYVKASKVYFLKSKTGNWSSTTENNTIKEIHPGYIYDADNNLCKPDKWLILGMDVKDYNYLMALIGAFIGFIFMFFTIELFMSVGGKK